MSLSPQFFKWWAHGESKAQTGHMTQIWKHFVAGFGSWKRHYSFHGMHRGKLKWSEENERKEGNCFKWNLPFYYRETLCLHRAVDGSIWTRIYMFAILPLWRILEHSKTESDNLTPLGSSRMSGIVEKHVKTQLCHILCEKWRSFWNKQSPLWCWNVWVCRYFTHEVLLNQHWESPWFFIFGLKMRERSRSKKKERSNGD